MEEEDEKDKETYMVGALGIVHATWRMVDFKMSVVVATWEPKNSLGGCLLTTMSVRGTMIVVTTIFHPLNKQGSNFPFDIRSNFIFNFHISFPFDIMRNFLFDLLINFSFNFVISYHFS